MDKDILDVVERAAIQIENAVKEKILSDIQPPNSPMTIALKKSSKTLIDSGAMLGSVTHQPNETDDGFLIGIFDPIIAEYALENEFGDHEHPERSFLRSAFDENVDRICSNASDEITDLLIKKLGK